MKNSIRSLFLLLALALAPVLSAQVVITVHGNVVTHDGQSNYLGGYAEGASASFTFVISSLPSFNTDNQSQRLVWSYYGPDDLDYAQPFIASMSGTGLTGTYVPSGSTESQFVATFSNESEVPNMLSLTNTDYTAGLGFLAPDNSIVSGIYFPAIYGGLVFTPIPGTPDPASYLGGFPGTYNYSSTYLWAYESPWSVSNPSISGSIRTTNGEILVNITSVTITSIPEPSTYPIIAGLGALGFVAWKRRKVAA